MERGRSLEVTEGYVGKADFISLYVCVGVYNIEMWNIAGAVVVDTITNAVYYFSDLNLTDMDSINVQRNGLFCNANKYTNCSLVKKISIDVTSVHL